MSLLKEGHVYSYSQLSSFDGCPYGFYLQRIERMEQTQNAFAEQGTLIHDLLDQWAKGVLTAEQLPDEYERRYPDEVLCSWPRMLASKGYAEKTYNQGLHYFQNFDEFRGYTVVAAEEKFRTDIAERPFIGIVDMVLRDQITDELIVLDHKSKSLASFRKSEDEMYRQQLIYSKYIKEKYGVFPDRLMFNLFKEDGLKQERPFVESQYNEALAWATDIIEKIESYDIVDWLQSKDQDFFCTELCSMRKHCANGTATYTRKKK